MIRVNWNVGLMLISCCVLVSGCGIGDETMRQQQALKMLEDLRRDVDLNGVSTPDIVVGQAMPKTSGVDIEGQEIDLEDVRGNVILLSFWGGG